MQVVEVIPFHSFKERLQLVKLIIGKGKITIYDNYIYFERVEGGKDD